MSIRKSPGADDWQIARLRKWPHRLLDALISGLVDRSKQYST